MIPIKVSGKNNSIPIYFLDTFHDIFERLQYFVHQKLLDIMFTINFRHDLPVNLNFNQSIRTMNQSHLHIEDPNNQISLQALEY